MTTKFIMSRYDYKSIQKLEPSIVFTNSEMMAMACNKKYGYSYIENLETDYFSYALFYGVSWHYLCEQALLIMKETDTIVTYQQLEDILNVQVCEFMRTYLDDFEDIDKEENFEKAYENIKLGMYGWIRKWEKEIHPFYKVVDVEKELIKPILDENGDKLEFEVDFVKEEYNDFSVLRFPLIGEIKEQMVSRLIKYEDFTNESAISCSFITKNIPAYRVGKLDCILLDREHNSLWILDHKTSGQPSSYAKKMTFDLQLYTYSSLLDNAIKNGEYKHLGDVFIGGIIWDIAHSKYNKPSFDKNGALKQVKRGYITLALAEKILKEPKYEFVTDEYDDYLKVLEDRDSSYYIIQKEIISDRNIKRINNEDISNTKKLVSLQSAAHRIDRESSIENDVVLPRYPVCLTYNSCSYFTQCVSEWKFEHTDMIDLQRKAKKYWIITE